MQLPRGQVEEAEDDLEAMRLVFSTREDNGAAAIVAQPPGTQRSQHRLLLVLLDTQKDKAKRQRNTFRGG
eukprot:1925241-Pyramimonas_sp.AAC.1